MTRSESLGILLCLALAGAACTAAPRSAPSAAVPTTQAADPCAVGPVQPIALKGEQGTYQLLIVSQVVLSFQLPFAVVPLILFTSSRRKMGRFANPRWLAAMAWLVTVVIVVLNVYLLVQTVGAWVGSKSPGAAAPAMTQP